MGRREEGGGSCWQADGCECRVLIKSHLGTMAFSYLEPAQHKAQLVRREDSPLPFFFFLLLTHFLGFVAMAGTLLNPLEYPLTRRRARSASSLTA